MWSRSCSHRIGCFASASYLSLLLNSNNYNRLRPNGTQYQFSYSVSFLVFIIKTISFCLFTCTKRHGSTKQINKWIRDTIKSKPCMEKWKKKKKKKKSLDACQSNLKCQMNKQTTIAMALQCQQRQNSEKWQRLWYSLEIAHCRNELETHLKWLGERERGRMRQIFDLATGRRQFVHVLVVKYFTLRVYPRRLRSHCIYRGRFPFPLFHFA